MTDPNKEAKKEKYCPDCGMFFTPISEEDESCFFCELNRDEGNLSDRDKEN